MAAAGTDVAAAPSPSEGVWSRVLARAPDAARPSALFLGDPSAARWLAERTGARLQPPHALTYSVLNLLPPAASASQSSEGLVGAWMLGGTGEAELGLLREALGSAEDLARGAAVVALDFARPWAIASSLARWLGALERHVASLGIRRERAADDAEQQRPPAPKNAGVPVVVALCGVDTARCRDVGLNEDEGHLSFIQQYLRRACLEYGAALVYVPASTPLPAKGAPQQQGQQQQQPQQQAAAQGKGRLGVEGLRACLAQVLLAQPAPDPELVERDSLLFPAGWDAEDRIRALLGGEGESPDFDEVIKAPARGQSPAEAVAQPQSQQVAQGGQQQGDAGAEGEQEFLARLKDFIDGTAVPEPHTPRAIGSAAVSKSGEQGPVPRQSPPPQPIGAASQQKGSFWTRFLSNKGAGGKPGAPSSGPSTPREKAR